MAGSVIGHGISNMLFGGRTQEQMPPPAEYAQQAIQQTGGCDIPGKGEQASEASERTLSFIVSQLLAPTSVQLDWKK